MLGETMQGLGVGRKTGDKSQEHHVRVKKTGDGVRAPANGRGKSGGDPYAQDWVYCPDTSACHSPGHLYLPQPEKQMGGWLDG